MSLVNVLAQAAKEMGLTLSDEQLARFVLYARLLKEWNKKINLTSIVEEEEIAVKHFADSLTCVRYLDRGEKVIDIGTGAGFPGLPLRIYDSSLRLSLLDSLNKRMNFVEEIVKTLGLDGVEILRGRAEEYGIKPQYREMYDCAVTRAVAHISVLYEYSLPFVRLGGRVICMKGPEVEAEVEEAQGALKILGGEILAADKVKLPCSDIVHTLVVIRKIRATPEKYPRSPGKPEKNPLR